MTVPLTLIVLAIRKAWMRRFQVSERGDEAQTEEAVACQHIAARESPISPRITIYSHEERL